MTAERWQQIEQLYHDALEREAGQRRAFLNEACAGNEALRREVAALLAANDDADDFLDEHALAVEAKEMAAERASVPAGSLVTEHFSHYQILSKIGAGGMGEVYLARDSLLERPVAIKVLPPNFIADADRLRRFAREAKAASSLNHPNIITIYEIGVSSGLHFIATEFIAGVTLRERLKDGKLSLREAMAITRQIAAALAAAHEAGIVHRDIKPENVMVRPDGLVKVLDFGLARVGERRQEPGDSATQESSHTQTGTVIGTPRYMSPEQARGLKVDARTDIFSLGVVLYELIAGQPPFTGATMAEVFAALLEKQPPPLAQYLPETLPVLPVLPMLEEIIIRALEKDCEDRYLTIRDFAADMEEIEQQISARAESGETRGLSQSGRKSGRRGAENQRASAPRNSRQLRAQPVRPAWREKRGLILSIALALLAALGIVGYQLRDRLFDVTRWSRTLSGPITTVPFATSAGQKDFACFSPDGSQIAFAWDGGQQREDGARDIYIKLIGVGDPVQLTFSPEDDNRPAWSPDNKHIAFLRQGVIYVIPSLPGGVERRLAEAGQGISWSPDSKVMAIAGPASKNAPGQILLISADTGERLQQLTAPSLPNSDDQPAFSPDGKWIAFLRSFGPTRREVFVIPASGGEPQQLTSDKRQIWGLAWTGNGREIVYATNRGGGMGLWRVRASGGAPERLTVPSLNPTSPAISRQDDRLAYTEIYTDSNIYSYEGAGFAGHATPDKFSQPVAFLTSSREDHSQQFSLDGQQIVFISMRSGSEELWVCNRDGKKLRQVTNFDGTPTGTPRWSPDGRWIAFDTRATGDAEVFIVNTEGGAPHNFTNSPSSYDATPSWSRDGQWLYFTSNRGGGGENIWKQPVAGGAAIQLTHHGAGEGFESADGQLFYFSKGRGGTGLWYVPAEGGEEKPVPELSNAGYWRSWGLLAQGIYFIAKEETPRQTVKFFSFATRRITPLVMVGKDTLWSHPGLALSPDGRTLLLAQKDHSVNDIMLMENFR